MVARADLEAPRSLLSREQPPSSPPPISATPPSLGGGTHAGASSLIEAFRSLPPGTIDRKEVNP